MPDTPSLYLEQAETTVDEPITDDLVEPLPNGLDSPVAKLVLLYLRVTRGGTTDEIARSLGVGLLTLYPTMRTLEAGGHVSKHGSSYVPT